MSDEMTENQSADQVRLNLGPRARSALGWQLLAQGTTTGVQMVVNIILARLLMPSDFGILGIATMMIGLVGIFHTLGLPQALIQRREVHPVHLASAFWGTLLMGLLLWGLMMAIAPAVGAFFAEPRMVSVLRVTALCFLIAPFGAVPRATLQRVLDGRRPFYATLAGTVVGGVVGVGMALAGYGYWSLVGTQLAASLVGTVGICALAGYVPPLSPTLRGVKDLYVFGVGFTGVGLFNHVADQADYFVVGRWLGTAELGLYTRAFTLISQPLGMVSATLTPVLFPTFSRIQDDPARARALLARVLTGIATFTFPALALFGVTAPELIPLVFGRQWSGAVVPAQILAAAGMIRTVANPGGAVIKAFGRVYGEAWAHAGCAAVVAVAAVLGSRWGITGVSWGVLLATCLFVLGIGSLVAKSCGFGATDYGRALTRPALIAAAVLAGTLPLSWVLRSHSVAEAVTLALTVTLGLAIGASALLLGPFHEARKTVREVLLAARIAR